MGKALDIRSRFSFKDDFSGGFSKMMKKAEGSLSSAETRFGRFSMFMQASEKNLKNVAKKSALIGTGIVAPLGLAAKAAIDFESSMADVAKVAGVAVGSDTFYELGEQAKQLGAELGVLPSEASELMAGLAQGGVAIEDLGTISRLAGKVGVAFGITSGEAGEAFVRTRNALGGTIEDTSRLMDAINHLGNTTAASAGNLIEFMSSGGAGAAAAAGASGEAVAAMGAQLISMGKGASETGTVMERFTKTVLMNKKLRRVFDQAGGGADGMFAVIEKGAKLTGKAQDEYFQQFGAYGLNIQLMAKNLDSLKEKMLDVSDATVIADSVNDEFANRTSTIGFKIDRLKSQLLGIAISIGDVLVPVISDLAEEIIPVVQNLSKWMSENKDLVKRGIKIAGVIAGVSFAVSGLSTALLGISKIMTIVKGVQIAWNLAMMMNPIGLLITGIVLLGTWVTLIITKFQNFGAVLGVLTGPIGYLINGIMLIKNYWSSIVDAFKGDGIIAGLKKIGVMLIDFFLYPLQQALNLVSKIPGMGNLAGGARDSINDLRARLGAVDIGGELSQSVAVSNEAVSPTNNKSEVLLTIDNNGERTTRDISGGQFDMSVMPNVSPTM